MPWVKLDDHTDENPKLLAAGPLGFALWTAGLCYCNRNLTDGFIPRAKALTLQSFEHIGIATGGVKGMFEVGEDATCELVATMLVDIGLWEEVAGGYQVHDYLSYQPSREDVLKDRADNAAKQERFRNKARNNDGTFERNPVSNPVTTSVSTTVPVPGPVPVPQDEVRTGADAPVAAPRKRKPRTAVKAQDDAPKERKPYPHGEQLGALLEATNVDDFDALTDSEKGRYRKAAKQLCEAHYGRAEILEARANWYQDCDCTATGIASNIYTLLHSKRPVRNGKANGSTPWPTLTYTEQEVAHYRGKDGRLSPESPVSLLQAHRHDWGVMSFDEWDAERAEARNQSD